MNIIGISGLHNSVAFKKNLFPNLPPRYYQIAQGFDSAAALVNEKGIKAAAEERFTEQKGTGAFPVNAIQYCLQAAGITPNDVDHVAHSFDYEPYKAFYNHNEFTQKQFAEVYSPEAQIRNLEEHLPTYQWSSKFVFVPHHLAHAASSYYLSGFREALIVVADAIGELHSTTIAIGRGNNIEIIKQIPAPHSLGILYGIVTMYLGFTMNSHEGKVMGLAPYGNPRRYFHKFMELVHYNDDGTYTTPILFYNHTIEEKETYSGTLKLLVDAFGPGREPNTEITQHHKDIAAALQATLQFCLMQVLQYYKKETGLSNLCMAGGVALNCVANSVIKRSRMYNSIFIQPAAGDDGSAVGAALYIKHLHQPELLNKRMDLPFWGPKFGNKAIEQVLQNRQDFKGQYFSNFTDLIEYVAKNLAEGKVVAWFQDRMEFGPRALGNRSILADPRGDKTREYINRLIKKREGFRPFAPAVIQETAAQFFEIDQDDDNTLFAYMLGVSKVKQAYREQLPAITHVDNSARVQVVSKEQHPKFWALLSAFGQMSGLPILLNTSFNLRDQPIVCNPFQAVNTFLSSELDMLAIENYVITHKSITLPV